MGNSQHGRRSQQQSNDTADPHPAFQVHHTNLLIVLLNAVSGLFIVNNPESQLLVGQECRNYRYSINMSVR